MNLATNWVVVRQSNLYRSLPMIDSTVRTLMLSCAAISLALTPSEYARTILTSRSDTVFLLSDSTSVIMQRIYNVKNAASKFILLIYVKNSGGTAFSVIFKKHMGTLITILIALLVFGLLYWVVNYVVPLPPPIKTIFNVVLVLALVIFLIWILMGLRGAF